MDTTDGTGVQRFGHGFLSQDAVEQFGLRPVVRELPGVPPAVELRQRHAAGVPGRGPAGRRGRRGGGRFEQVRHHFPSFAADSSAPATGAASPRASRA